MLRKERQEWIELHRSNKMTQNYSISTIKYNQ
jgi:hypothetical protein